MNFSLGSRLILRLSRSNQQWANAKRSIFSASYLSVSSFSKNRLLWNLKTFDINEEKKKIHDLYDKMGSKNLFTEDILALLNISDTEEDMDFLVKVLKEVCADSLRQPEILSHCLNLFFKLCHVKEDTLRAQELFNDPKISHVLSDMTRLVYYTFLYNHQRFEEMAKLATACGEMTRDEATLFLAALFRLGTTEAFLTATNIYERQNKSKATVRMSQIYATFAMHQNELAKAYAVVSDALNAMSEHKSQMKPTYLVGIGVLKSLRLAILIKSDRLEEAFKDIEARLSDPKAKTLKVNYDIMKLLADSVKASDSEEKKQRFIDLCSSLTNCGEIMHAPIDEIVLSPIGM